MQTIVRDIRLAFRSLLKDKGFSMTVVLTLALCIGANTAIFAIVHSVLLRPLPVPRAEEILLMSNQYPRAGAAGSHNSGGADYYDRLKEVTVLQEQAMFNFGDQTIELNGTPEKITGMNATPSLFRLLQVSPLLGRAFTDEEGNRRESESPAQLRPLAPDVCRRARRLREGNAPEWPPIHHRRRHARGFHVYQSDGAPVGSTRIHAGAEKGASQQ